MANISAYSISGNTNSFISVNEGSELTIYNSNFKQIDNFESGAVLNAGYQNSITQVYNSIFTENASINGGVANVQDGSVIKFYNCTFTNNFAIESGVIRAKDDGYFEFYDSKISSNYAYSLPISVIFISTKTCLLNNTLVTQNKPLAFSTISLELSNCSVLCFLSSSYKSYLLNTPSVFSIKQLLFGVEAISGVLKISGGTKVVDQPYFLNTYLSTVHIENSYFDNITTERYVLFFSDSEVELSYLEIENITEVEHGVFLAASYETDIRLKGISYTNSIFKFASFLSASVQINDTKISNLD